VKGINRLNGEPFASPVWKFKWKTLLDNAEWERPTCAALSADGRFLAVADEPGNVHVADLKRKRVVAVHQKARLTADRVIGRVAIDNTGERVFRMANGVLHGPNWQFRAPSGKPTDFALSPDQRTVCAVFDTGHARTFDAATGAVRKELRWGKKPLYSVCFAPDGLTCAAGGLGGRVVVWDVDA
jgi:WD40 repeat protein